MTLLETARKLALHGRVDSLEIPNISIEEAKKCSKDLESLHDIMKAPHVGLALHVLQRSGFFDYWIPEIRESLELKSSKQFKEIWPHTIRVVNQTPSSLVLRWSALFHDLGKAQSFSIRDGKVTFWNHEKISARIFDNFAKRAPHLFNKGQKYRIHFLISNLGYAEGYERSWTDSAVRRFSRDIGDHVDDLLKLSSADITTSKPEKKEKILRRIDEFRKRIEEIKEFDSKQQQILPKGLGNKIATEFDIPLGPKIGEIRKSLEKEVNEGELLANQEFDYYIKFLRGSSSMCQ